MPLSHQANEFLSRFLGQRSDHLHHSIMVQGQDVPESLTLFIERYVGLAADIVATLNNVIHRIGIGGEMAQQAATAQQFLDIPLTIVSRQQELESQMYQAYLAGRFVEELNDVVETQCGNPVISVDITKSNLLVHHIIGEPFANQLDAAIQSLGDRLARSIETDSMLRKKLRAYCNSLNSEEIPSYSCLAETCHIHLVFNSKARYSD
ncbi:MAG: hypothetical protein ACPH58_04900 [Porticoccaceae bacterium]